MIIHIKKSKLNRLLDEWAVAANNRLHIEYYIVYTAIIKCVTGMFITIITDNMFGTYKPLIWK